MRPPTPGNATPKKFSVRWTTLSMLNVPFVGQPERPLFMRRDVPGVCLLAVAAFVAR